MKNADEIKALAAELTEADLAAILVAKVPDAICGRRVHGVSLCCNRLEFGDAEWWSYMALHAGGVSHIANSPDKAVARLVEALTKKLGDPVAIAAEKRAAAAKLIAEADALQANMSAA